LANDPADEVMATIFFCFDMKTLGANACTTRMGPNEVDLVIGFAHLGHIQGECGLHRRGIVNQYIDRLIVIFGSKGLDHLRVADIQPFDDEVRMSGLNVQKGGESWIARRSARGRDDVPPQIRILTRQLEAESMVRTGNEHGRCIRLEGRRGAERDQGE
jgi:hypothetical protein